MPATLLSTALPSGFRSRKWLARFAGDGTLYGANPLALYTIDPKNGLATKVIGFSPNVAGNVMGLFINGEGKFYLADYTPDSFVYDLNPQTGTAAPS